MRLGAGTFRVSNHSFAFSNGKTNYKNTATMWQRQINWNNVRKSIESQTKGSQRDAKEMTDILNNLGVLTPEEWNLVGAELKDLFGINPYTEEGTVAGIEFEERFARLLSKLFNERHWLTGKSQRSDESRFRAGQKGSKGAEFEVEIFAGHKVAKSNLRDIIMNRFGGDLAEFSKDLVIRAKDPIQNEKSQEWKTPAIVRTVERQGKVDVYAPESLIIREGLSHRLMVLAALARGRTFSMKNYKAETLRSGVSLGEASNFKYLSSFYYYAAGNKNFVDVCTFVFSSMNSNRATTVRYKNWARLIYELTGAGQESGITDLQGRLVDYLMVLQRTHPIQIRIVDVKSILQLDRMPNIDPSSIRRNFIYRGGELKGVI